MNPRSLQVADEFCRLVDTPDLLSYLDAGPSDGREAVVAALKAKRRYMQGMQSNPKYRRAALHFIKNFTDLEQVLDDPLAYHKEIARRARSEALPMLEAIVQGAMLDGPLTSSRRDALWRKADTMGFTRQEFDVVIEAYDRPNTEEIGDPATVLDTPHSIPLITKR